MYATRSREKYAIVPATSHAVLVAKNASNNAVGDGLWAATAGVLMALAPVRCLGVTTPGQVGGLARRLQRSSWPIVEGARLTGASSAPHGAAIDSRASTAP